MIADIFRRDLLHQLVAEADQFVEPCYCVVEYHKGRRLPSRVAVCTGSRCMARESDDGAGGARPMVASRDVAVAAVCDAHGTTIEEVRSNDRHKSITRARAAVVVELRDAYEMSYPEIGCFIQRDHTTVMVLEKAGRTGVSALDVRKVRP